MNIKEEEEESATETENVEEAELEDKLSEKSIEETAETGEKALAEAGEEEAVEKEKKPAKKKKKGEEEEIVEERVYTIPLGKATVRPPKKRAPRAMQLIRAFVTKHMKVEMHLEEEEEEGELPRVIISSEVNEKVWGRGIEKPPRKIRVRAAKDSDGNVTVYLAEVD